MLLTERMKKVSDFLEAERIHWSFLDALITQSFLDVRQIAQLLEPVLSLCHCFSSLVQA